MRMAAMLMRNSNDDGNGNANGGEGPLDARDVAALELALKVRRARSAPDAQQIDWMLAERSRVDVMKFAAYSCQMASLRLKPWEQPPAHVSVDDKDRPEQCGGETAAAKLLRKMLRHGVSKWHPNPMGAIERAQDADRGPHVTQFAIEMFKSHRRGHDFRDEIHAELGLASQHPSVLDIDMLADPPPSLTGAALANWKLAKRLLGQLIVGEVASAA